MISINMKSQVFCYFLFSLIVFVNADSVQEVEEYIAKAKESVNQRYRLKYHIAAPVGWINDPNGFSFYNGEYHIFYQYYPYDSIWGPMHWGHMISADLVSWKWVQVALVPGNDYDKDGCFSGSAVENEGNLTLIYTGHIVDEEGNEYQNQNIAFSADGINFVKYGNNPVIPEPHDGVYAFRDPKVWKNGEYFYMIVGNATPDGRGRVVLYKSRDLKDWEFVSTVAESTGDMGYMWECPDFFELGGKYVLLMSPQGIETQGDLYRNLHQTGYILGDFDYEVAAFSGKGELSGFVTLDHGYDFYAAQTMESPDGRRILIGWLDMWQNTSKTYLEELDDGWAGALTITRELTMNSEGHLLMNPVEEYRTLRVDSTWGRFYRPGSQLKVVSKATELEVYSGISDNEYEIIFNLGGDKFLQISYQQGVVRMFRSDKEDDRSAIWSPKDQLYWRIFIDSSSLELFCGKGEAVFSTRIYPDGDITLNVGGTSKLYIIQHSLQEAMTY